MQNLESLCKNKLSNIKTRIKFDLLANSFHFRMFHLMTNSIVHDLARMLVGRFLISNPSSSQPQYLLHQPHSQMPNLLKVHTPIPTKRHVRPEIVFQILKLTEQTDYADFFFISYLQEIPNGILNFFDYITMSHPISSYITLPIDCVKIFVLTNSWYVITI